MAHPQIQSHSLNHYSTNPSHHPPLPTLPSLSTSQEQFSTALASRNPTPHCTPRATSLQPQSPPPLLQTAHKQYQLPPPHAAPKNANHAPTPKPSLANTATSVPADRQRVPPIRCAATCSTDAAAKRFAQNAFTNSGGTWRRHEQRHQARGSVRTASGNVPNVRSA